MNTLKLIFLDIDGVFNSEKFYDYILNEYPGKTTGWIKDGNNLNIDPNAVDLFVKFLESDSSIKLVISSCWRFYSVEKTKNYFDGIKSLSSLSKYIVGVTPRIDSRIRGEEIKYFLNYIRKKDFNKSNSCFDEEFWNNAKYDKLKYCIIDDDSDMLEEQLKNFVQTDNSKGLTNKDIEKIINILN